MLATIKIKGAGALIDGEPQPVHYREGNLLVVKAGKPQQFQVYELSPKAGTTAWSGRLLFQFPVAAPRPSSD